MRYTVNASIMLTDLPVLERPAAVARAGFSAVEFWWPWPDQPSPGDAEVDRFVGAVRDAGVRLVGLNFFAGDLSGTDAGVVSLPQRVDEFRDNVDVVVAIGQALEVPAFNALYGVRVDDARPEEQDELAGIVRALLAKRADSASVRTAMESDEGYDTELWQTMCEQIGVAALAVDERIEIGWIDHSAIPLTDQAQRYLDEVRAVVDGFGITLLDEA